MLDDQHLATLCRAAIEARSKAYAPHSGFAVGAAILCTDNTIFTGCNVENDVFGLSICAERTAVCKAVSEGNREFSAIVIAANPIASPCGSCRQFLAQFVRGQSMQDFKVIGCDAESLETRKIWHLRELLPDSFIFSR